MVPPLPLPPVPGLNPPVLEPLLEEEEPPAPVPLMELPVPPEGEPELSGGDSDAEQPPAQIAVNTAPSAHIQAKVRMERV